MFRIKTFFRKILPRDVLLLYHHILTVIGAWYYRHPSRQLIVIGITGTKGKSTTGNIVWHILQSNGYSVGLTGTVNIRIGTTNRLSTAKMTMPGRFQLQKLLRQMVHAQCSVAIIETTSEGIVQSRHHGIAYDICALTNLSPEHIESHGGFENYKNAKKELFRYCASLPPKILHDNTTPRASVVNAENPFAEEFWNVGPQHHVRVGHDASSDVVIDHITEFVDHTNFFLNGTPVTIPLLGSWNAMNAAMAVGIGMTLGLSLKEQCAALADVPAIPGRMEHIHEGQKFQVIVDYAHEPKSLKLLYDFFRTHRTSQARLITLISSTGGGRDVARRQKNGAIAGALCDMVIVTDEDPYDDNPQTIIDEVAKGVIQSGKKEGKNFWRIRDRRDAIAHALHLAHDDDIVIIPCKGAEQKMCLANGKKIHWDDRDIVREFLRTKKTDFHSK